jgi:hypothetical protein
LIQTFFMLLLILFFVYVAASGDLLYVSYGQDSTCNWPLEWRNYSLPHCFRDMETSISLTSNHLLLWQAYAPPFQHCNSQVDVTAFAPLDSCTDVSVYPPNYDYYVAHWNMPPPHYDAARDIPTNVTVLYYTTNACADQPSQKESITMQQCHPGIGYPSFAFDHFRKNGTEDILVAEFWDSPHSCSGLNRAWRYLHNGVCGQIAYPCAYRSWIAYW